MKFSEQWLRKWVNPPISTAVMCEQLTLAGLEVDSIEPAAGEFSHVVVGEVLRVEQHPDADRLRVCHVNVGDEELQIVCGGANVRVGLKVAVATIGATLPGNFKIKKSKLRGVESQGMLCSASELGLAETSEGILELPSDAPIAADVRHYLQLDDVSIDIELTPNRGDCASVLGVAREVAAINDMLLEKEFVAHAKATIKDSLPITISAPRGCG
ncbi:MAG: phenylalanine--tRNA ligase subunit beta, partial [Pseudomonadota bacterium]|nr:phenylalanine--tRNA ligase subunit beta [Pseudomonadota bacterium]